MKLNGALWALFLSTLFALPAYACPQSGIPGVVAPGIQPELVQEGFVFTEGPVGTADGGLYFSDVRANQTYRMDVSGKITRVRENTEGANGLALTHDGDLLSAVGDGKKITRWTRDGRTTTLTDSFEGKPFLAPNDLIVDAKGGIYFTDPGPRPLVPGRKAYVFYLPAGAKQPLLIDDQVVRPNGLTLTVDRKILIVDDTVGEMIFAYSVQPDGSVKDKRKFARLHDIQQGMESGADGMVLDRDNRIYVTTVTGVQVFDSAGQFLGTIRVPRQPANVAFSGPGKHTLYITAREGLYRIQMLSQGADRLGK